MPEHPEAHGMRRCLTFRYLRAEAPPGRAGDTKVFSVIVAGFGLLVVVVVVVAAVAVAAATTPTMDHNTGCHSAKRFCSNQATR